MAKNGNAYGTLFAQDYLEIGIRNDPDWAEVSAEELADRLRPIYERFPTDKRPNESQTEEDLIWPVLKELGWTAYLRQQNLSRSGRNLVPDGLLFLNEAAKERANEHEKEWKRYGHGVALVESKRWSKGENIDRSLDLDGGGVAAATQMLYYLRRADVLTEGNLKWGILTDGMLWRLYWQDARSVSDQYFQINLAPLLGYDYGGRIEEELSDEEALENMRLLKIFGLMFRRKAFQRTPPSNMTFHERALKEGEFYEARVARNLSDKVFSSVFPSIANAIYEAAPEADLLEIRDTALTLMYRLLFVFFAEDRNFLPVDDHRYDSYSIREKVRMDVKKRKDVFDTFSDKQANYWATIDNSSRALEHGDTSIGLPPYNGGLFDSERTPLLSDLRISDIVMANIIDELSFEIVDGERRYINYRDLSVQHLGSIYERLLEYDLIRDSETGLVLHPNVYARKSSGSYYTPDSLIRLVVRETLEPVLQDIRQRFYNVVDSIKGKKCSATEIEMLNRADPASAMLKIRVCDPAMGSGPFLVHFIDYLSDQIIEAMGEVKSLTDWKDGPGFKSPLHRTIDDSAGQIHGNADEMGWFLEEKQIDDQRIVRRMVLKRCVYGVDKNEMAVELAKVSLWLHSFTMGAPLSFIDHHLRVGDSLFGEWVKSALDRLTGRSLLIGDEINDAKDQAEDMRLIDKLNDLEIVEVRNAARNFKKVRRNTKPLDTLMCALHALRWIKFDNVLDEQAVNSWLDGVFGDPVKIILDEKQHLADNDHGSACDEQFAGTGNGREKQIPTIEEKQRINCVLSSIRQLIEEEGFINWEVSFPGVWGDWETGRTGGFDAVIGNPPWDRIKFQEIEWLAAREPSIARTPNADQRKKLVKKLKRERKGLAQDWERARSRSETMLNVAKKSGEYPKMSGGDVNIYSLFVERSMSLLKPDGMLGLLTPTGIATDKTSSKFFSEIAREGRLKSLYDFVNGNIFPDVHSSFRFCAFTSSRTRTFKSVKCAFLLKSTSEQEQNERIVKLSARDMIRLNPNTGTMPMFRSQRDADLTAEIYKHFPVLVNRSKNKAVQTWPVRHLSMLHMTSDSDKFRTAMQLNDVEGAWRVDENKWENRDGIWQPLYVGKMFNQFDHRAASIEINEKNVHHAALSVFSTAEEKVDPTFTPNPQYWVRESEVRIPEELKWTLAFRAVTNATNERTVIAAIIPRSPVGNNAPLLLPTESDVEYSSFALLLGNLNSTMLNYVARQKMQGTALNWYIVEQLPVIPPEAYAKVKFGKQTAEDVVKESVLELTYTSHNLKPFAKDLKFVDNRGKVHKPFVWNEERRLRLRAKLDAVYFHLYGIYNSENLAQSIDDISYIYSTFPIVEKGEIKEYGHYAIRDMALAYCNALAAGKPDAIPEIAPRS